MGYDDVGKNRQSPRRTKIGSKSGNSLENKLLAYMILQNKSKEGAKAMPGGIPVRRTDPITGITEESPQGQDFDIQTTSRKKAVTDAATAITALRRLVPILNEFESGFKQAYPDAKTQIGLPGKIQAAKRIFKGKVLEGDPEFSAFVDQLEGKRSQIAKGLGEVGNLAEQEQKVAMQNVPEFGMGGISSAFLPEAPATGAAKLPKFRSFVENQIQQNMDVIKSGGKLENLQDDPIEAIKKRFRQRNP